MSEEKSLKPKELLKRVINRKRLIIAGIIFAVFLCFAIYAIYAANYDKVYPNTYIEGIDVSGLTYDEVKEKINATAQDTVIPKEIEFSIGGDVLSISSEDIDLRPDTEKTAKAVMGERNKKGFFSRAFDYTSSFTDEKKFYITFSYDEKKLNKAISEFAEPYETQPVDAGYKIEGNTLIITKAQPGKKVSKKTLNEDLSKYIKNPIEPITLKLEIKKEKDFDLNKLYAEITSESKDAYYSRDNNGNVIVVADKPQVTIDKDVLEKALNSDEKVVRLDIKTIPAKVTQASLKEALFSGVMGSWTSNFSASNTSRTANVTLSAQRINGTVLLPGETFSYDKTVGPRTTQNGFKVAGVYINNKVEQGVGGGVCQTSSTLYSAVLYANLEIVSRTSHSLPVSYMPPGQDATIAEGSIDFKFKNNTKYPIKIAAAVNGGSITCDIIGTPVPGQKVVINNSTTGILSPKIEINTSGSIPKGYKKTAYGSSGSTVASSRTVYLNGAVVKTETLTGSRYNATPTVVTVNPADKNASPDSLKEYSSSTIIVPPEDVEEHGNNVNPTPAPSAPPISENEDSKRPAVTEPSVPSTPQPIETPTPMKTPTPVESDDSSSSALTPTEEISEN